VSRSPSSKLAGKLVRLALTLAIGVAGGVFFHLIGMPAPWLAGAMVAVLIACLCGVKVETPKAVTPAVMVLLGLSIGSSVDWETLELMRAWPASLAILAVTMLLVTVALQIFYRRAYGWDSRTSFFSSVPGALSNVIAFTIEYRADVLRVTIVQTVRLVMLVVLLPLVITVAGVHGPEPTGIPAPTHSLPELALVIAAGAAGGWLFQLIRVPAGSLLGAAVANIALHLSGYVSGSMPDWLLVPTFLIFGVVIGCRFSGMTVSTVLQSAGAGMKGFLLASVIAVTGALLTSYVVGIPYAETLLAFAPGGLDAMTILAFALNVDPAYVGAHQVFRFLLMTIAMPLALLMFPKPDKSSPGRHGTRAEAGAPGDRGPSGDAP
jgi:membrane AbrB-like protein